MPQPWGELGAARCFAFCIGSLPRAGGCLSAECGISITQKQKSGQSLEPPGRRAQAAPPARALGVSGDPPPDLQRHGLTWRFSCLGTGLEAGAERPRRMRGGRLRHGAPGLAGGWTRLISTGCWSWTCWIISNALPSFC